MHQKQPVCVYCTAPLLQSLQLIIVIIIIQLTMLVKYNYTLHKNHPRMDEEMKWLALVSLALLCCQVHCSDDIRLSHQACPAFFVFIYDHNCHCGLSMDEETSQYQWAKHAVKCHITANITNAYLNSAYCMPYNDLNPCYCLLPTRLLLSKRGKPVHWQRFEIHKDSTRPNVHQ